MKNPPLLRVSGLSGRVYLLTRYRVEARIPKDKSKPAIYSVVASQKHDVTDEFTAALEAWRELKGAEPDLLEAARALLADYDAGGTLYELKSAIANLRAAVSRAEGATRSTGAPENSPGGAVTDGREGEVG